MPEPARPHTDRERPSTTLAGVPRLSLGTYPTPLDEAPNLRRALGPRCPRILVKRDDLTGFGLGGNKVRKLEYELAPDRTEDVSCLVTTGGPQSNHARVTAAAAARLGLRCVLVINGTPPDPPTGNALLHRLSGAEVRVVTSREEREPAMAAVAGEIEASGGRALVVPLGASTPLGAIGYVRAALEFADQWRGVDPGPDSGRTWIFVAGSSGGTAAGLLLGLHRCSEAPVRLVAVSADVPADELLATATTIGQRAALLLGWDPALPADLLEASDAYVGVGYGIPTPASTAALRLFARTEGIILDPVYSAKAAAGMVDWIRRERITREDTVVFWHTGGFPALFA